MVHSFKQAHLRVHMRVCPACTSVYESDVRVGRIRHVLLFLCETPFCKTPVFDCQFYPRSCPTTNVPKIEECEVPDAPS